MSETPAVVVETQGDRGDEGSDVMTTCLGTQILWAANNAKLFRDLCQRTSRFCEEGQPCALVSDEGRILLVSSERPMTSTPQRTAFAPEVSAEARAPSGPSRSSEVEP